MVAIKKKPRKSTKKANAKKERKVTKKVQKVEKNKGGRPPIPITDDVCEKAKGLATRGLTMEQIATVLKMGESTLYEKMAMFPEFSEAISIGRVEGLATVSNALFKKAESGDFQSVRYYLSTRDRQNWAETTKHEITGKDGGAIEVDDAAAARQALRSGLVPSKIRARKTKATKNPD